MQKMPALPSPLNQLIGKKASLLDKRLYQLILNYQNTNNQFDTQIHYLAVNFAEQDDSKKLGGGSKSRLTLDIPMIDVKES